MTATLASTAHAAPGMTAKDFHRLVEVSAPTFTPDGATVVYVAGTHNLEKDIPVSDLWTVPYAGGAPAPLTTTPEISEWAPAVSTDGKWVFFLSDAGDDTQVWKLPASGGKAEQVTMLAGGVSDFALSPDGTHVAVTAEVGKTVGFKGTTTPPIVIDRFQFKEDYRDYLDDRRQQIFTVDLATGDATQITDGDYDNWLPSWSPDGQWIAFVSKREGADPDRNLNFDVYVAPPVKGAEPRKISDFEGTDVDPYWESRPQWSPDSKKLLWLQSGEDKWIYYTPWQLTVADLSTGKITKPGRIDRSFYHPHWSADGKKILALIEQPEDTLLAEIDPKTDKVKYLTTGKRFGYDLAVAPNGRTVVLDGVSDRPYEISAVERRLRPLTDHNAWVRDTALGQTVDRTFTSDGYEIHSIVTLPVGYQPGKAYPTILLLHGGPVYQFSHEFMIEWQVYAANGFVVVAVNPRGSSGRGFDFSKQIYADWGHVDTRDVLAGVDDLVKAGIADPARLGVGGRSYGGILTNAVISRDTRFKAAISGAGTANALGSYGIDQYSREYELELGTPWKNTDAYIRNSYPFLHADRITTPTLFYCEQEDFNVPCAGAEQMYQALKSTGVATRLVIYPGENHPVTVPSYLEDRMNRMLGWYSRYLRP